MGGLVYGYDRPATLARVHQIPRHRFAWDLLDPDVVFESPVVHAPQRGREVTCKYLASAVRVLGGPTFRYLGEWTNGSGAVLEFVTEVDGITINGVDIIT